MKRQLARTLYAAIAALAGVAFAVSPLPLMIPRASAVTAGDWPTYLHDAQRSAASSDPGLSVSNAASLAPLWSFKTGGVISTSATVVDGTAYVGSWDGYEYALDAATGALRWRTYLGVTNVPNCSPPNPGISSTATVAGGTVYVGGGDQYWYALDAVSGAVLWKVYTGDNSATGGYYNWSSPLIANGFAYIGISSLGDCPLVPGQLLKVDLSSHQVVATWNAVPTGRVGGGVWTSPTLDPTTNTIYLSTGTEGGSEPLAQAIVALDANTLTLQGSWKLPATVTVPDSDFGTTPLLFTDASGRRLVGAVNKNGIFYALDASNLNAGPVWQQTIAAGGSCPTCGDASVSSGAFANSTIYQAGGTTTIAGASYRGSIRALDPTTGAIAWEHPEPAPVIPALAYDNGLVIAAAGSKLDVLDASTGQTLYQSTLNAASYGPPSVSNGTLFANSVDGTIYAFAQATCPGGWSCADVGPVGLAGSQSLTNGTWTIQGAGADISAAPDAFHFVWQDLAADGAVSAQVTSQQAINSYSKAGVMLRASTDPGSPYYAALITPQNGIRVQLRSTQGGAMSNAATPAGTVPAYLKVSRSGQTFSAYTSTDGTAWTLIPGSTKSIAALSGSLLAGLADTAHNVSKLSTVTFTSVRIDRVVPPPACPTGWTCADIGAVGLAGSQSLNNGTWTIQGAGADISAAPDAFHFVWQNLAADGAVSAQITAQQPTNSYAKAGVMIRASSDPGSPYYAALMTPQHGIRVQMRATQGGAMVNAATPAGLVPIYLEVTRTGQSFSAYTSSDGTNWSLIPNSTRTIAALTGPSLAGLADTSHNAAALSTVTFNSVIVG